MAERVTYYALRETDEPEATGLFRVRESDTALRYERMERGGVWVKDNGLIDYLKGKVSGSDWVSEEEARDIAARLGGGLER